MLFRCLVALRGYALLLLLVASIYCLNHQLADALLLSSEPVSEPALQAPTIHLKLPWALTDADRSTPTQDYPPIRISLPANGSVNTVPLHFRCDFQIEDTDEFLHKHGHDLFCLEIDGEWKQCSPLMMASSLPTHLPPGNHSAVAYMVENASSRRFLESDVVSFAVLPDRRARTQQKRTRRVSNEKDLDLLAWVSIFENDTATGEDFTETLEDVTASAFVNSHYSQPSQREHRPVVLIIGVKTSILYGFPSRQAIRDTWASETLQEALGFRVFFVGCQPVIFEAQHQHQREALIRAIETEKQQFGDLLTDELECEDSYFTLPTKVKEFLHFAATEFPQVPYVMIADDDIYLRVDQLTQALRQHGSRSQFYAGQVWAQHYQRAAPICNPSNKNQISEAQYPMSELPPYASGPHYIMSMDCAEFIGVNRNELKGLSASDDVSVGLWLLALQAHPEHHASFQNLRDETCREDLVSLADLTPLAIRLVHENLEVSAPFCRGFDVATWLKPNQEALKLGFKRHVSFAVQVEMGGTGLEVTTEVTLEYGVIATSFYFSPSRNEFRDLSAQVCTYLNKIQIYQYDCDEIASQIYNAMVNALDQVSQEEHFSAATLTLWRHNLRFALTPASQAPRSITLMYSSSGKQGNPHVECIFASMYPHNPIRVVDQTAVQHNEATKATDSQPSPPPDVFVFSIMDGGCAKVWSPPCKALAANFVHQFGSSSSTSLIMISGEPHEIDELDERVLLLSTLSGVNRKRHVYLPMASMVFAGGIRKSPMLLLSDRAHKSQIDTANTTSSPRMFCAYMYARCQWPQREYMFDLLNAMEPVDALGMCQGAARKPIVKRWWARVGASAFEDAIKIYSNYKFVIAFENTQQQPGYVTEKIINAYLARSIPIYLGHSDSVAQLFNPRSFIDCGRFATLRKCAERVIEVHQSAELYEAMLNEPVIGNVTLFHELFSWHPDVPSSHLADSIAALLQQKR